MISSHGDHARPIGTALSALTLLLGGQGLILAQSIPTPPGATLKWSMTKYAALPTFQADCNWSETFGAMPGGQEVKRTLWYKKPNLFKVVSSRSAGRMVQTSVSDGAKLVEYTVGVGTPAQSYAAPASIADVSSMQMNHPMFCGSLIYKFFGGPAKYPDLVDEAKMPVRFGPSVTLEGHPCKTVTFWAKGAIYGKTEVAIGRTDGLIYRICYGSEPLMKTMQSGVAQEQIKKMMDSPEVQAQLKKSGSGADPGILQAAMDKMKNMPPTALTTESYVHIAVGKPVDPAVFTTTPPTDQPVQEMGGGSDPQPPVALGRPAPEIHVMGIDGVKRKLSDYRGQIVLIDFWATWCPPCRKGLPVTQSFYTEYGKRGLAVLTVSDETKADVLPFIRQNRYTFPVYLDAGGVTNKAYKVVAIPTVAIIDRKGNLSWYDVGLSPREDILAALKKAGLDTR